MVCARYHLHLVDGGDPGASLNAATLFAHFTLRCGHLQHVLLVSASTTDAAKRHNHLNAPGGTGAVSLLPPMALPHESNLSEDSTILKAAEACLRGEGSLMGLPLLPHGPQRIEKYLYFQSNFAEAEQSLLARHVPYPAEEDDPVPYFDLIAAADVASFGYIVDYYQRQRLNGASSSSSATSPLQKRGPVAVLHVACTDGARAGQLLQRFVETVLQLDGAKSNLKLVGEPSSYGETALDDAHETPAPSGGQRGTRTSWLDMLDETTTLFSQLLGPLFSIAAKGVARVVMMRPTCMLRCMPVNKACHTLGFRVPPQSAKVLKKRFIDLTKLHHPDQHAGDANATERMAKLVEAYRTLQKLLATGVHARNCISFCQSNGHEAGTAKSSIDSVAASFRAPGSSLSLRGFVLPWQRAATSSATEAAQAQFQRDNLTFGEYIACVRAAEQNRQRREARLQQEHNTSASNGSHGFTGAYFEERRRVTDQLRGAGGEVRRRSLVALAWQYYRMRFVQYVVRGPRRLMETVRYIVQG